MMMRAIVSPLLSLLVAFLVVHSAESEDPDVAAVVSQHVQCSLSTSTSFFAYNETTGVYVEVTDNDDTTRMLRPRNGVVTHTAVSDSSVQHVKACWCTQFFDRPVEYCPLNFDTCVVRGETGPVSCYSTSGAATFVRGFWPVAVFWFLGVLYGIFFTEPGGSFRDYLRRTICLQCASNTSEELLKRDVDRLVSVQPERAVFLYRQALSRQRRESMRQQTLAQTAGRLQTTPDDLPVAFPTSVAGPVEDAPSASAADHPERTLALKTRVFRSCSVSDDDAAQPPAGPTPMQRSHHVPQSVQGSAWLPSQFTREHVTLDEMDGELEQGVRCAICLDRLEHGDVVGDIPCEHVFHKDCLKDWLRKKNRCPLCQRPEVATPNFQSSML